MAEIFFRENLFFLPFLAVGIFLIGLGIWLVARAHGRHSVEVDAECIAVDKKDVATGVTAEDRTYYKNTQCPVYRYWYNGQYYTSSPLLQSNRPGYKPKLGSCRIRINPDHPERVYSSERKFAAAILISIGAIYVIMVVVLYIVFRYMGILLV